MKIRALSRLSGPTGVQMPGDEFIVDAATGADLIERRAAEEVLPVPAETPGDKKPAKKKA